MIDLSKIPNKPGCYIYLDKNKKIIYVGKAKDLKKRVSSYFNKKDLDTKTKVLVSKIKDIDFIVTNSEIEAFILENSLIKKNSPKYNIDLKDSKSYAYIEKTKEDWPRLIVSRGQKYDKKGKLFGPFVSAQSRDYVLQTLNKTFKLRTCKKLPKRKCIRYDIGVCSAPCINKISKKEYLENLHSAELVLNGKIVEITKKLKNNMKNYSTKKDFENALIAREQISSINYLKERQIMDRNKKYNEDIVNYLIKDDKIYLLIFNIYRGTLENKKEFIFDYEKEFLEKFLSRYYSENIIPKKIILPVKINESLKKYLSKIKKKKVEVIVPKIGELKELLNLVLKNIEITFFGDLKKLEDLKNKLNLQNLPKVIECFDISHLGGTETVASMVQFRFGKPDKSNYRKFKIKTVEGIDDFKSIEEVVRRRYRGLKEKGELFPDLIVIDGGIGQLHYAEKALKELGLKIPLISLAKREEEVYVIGKNKPIVFNSKNKAKLLLQAIRDEAHRLAISFQKLRRKKIFFDKK